MSDDVKVSLALIAENTKAIKEHTKSLNDKFIEHHTSMLNQHSTLSVNVSKNNAAFMSFMKWLIPVLIIATSGGVLASKLVGFV